MTNFDKIDFMVLPVEDATLKRPNLNGKSLPWKTDEHYCSWQEREDLYPGIKNWYVVPSSLVSYSMNGVEIGYYVIDVDNHDNDNFAGAIKFLKECNIPRTLTVRTPSGGLHMYYWALRDAMPEQVMKANPTGLPIEIKTKTGVLAPNGEDRVVIVDEPIAYLPVVEGSLFTEIARLTPKKKKRMQKKPVNKDYVVPEPEALPESSRHDTMIRKAKFLQDDGCPDEKVLDWLMKTRDMSPGYRKISDQELYDIIDWEGSSVTRPKPVAVVSKVVETPVEEKPAEEVEMAIEDPLEGTELLTGEEAEEVIAVFFNPETGERWESSPKGYEEKADDDFVLMGGYKIKMSVWEKFRDRCRHETPTKPAGQRLFWASYDFPPEIKTLRQEIPLGKPFTLDDVKRIGIEKGYTEDEIVDSFLTWVYILGIEDRHFQTLPEEKWLGKGKNTWIFI